MCDKQNINFPKCTEEFPERKKKKSLKTWNKRPSSSDHFPPAFFKNFSLSESLEDYVTI